MSIRYGKPRKNKKRRDPRYFLHETIEEENIVPDVDIGKIFDKIPTEIPDFEDIGKIFGDLKDNFPDFEMPKGTMESLKKICSFKDQIIGAIIEGKLGDLIEFASALNVMPKKAQEILNLIEEMTGKTIDELISNVTLRKMLIRLIEDGCEMVLRPGVMR
mgnify:CR=1 FL=1